MSEVQMHNTDPINEDFIPKQVLENCQSKWETLVTKYSSYVTNEEFDTTVHHLNIMHRYINQTHPYDESSESERSSSKRSANGHSVNFQDSSELDDSSESSYEEPVAERTEIEGEKGESAKEDLKVKMARKEVVKDLDDNVDGKDNNFILVSDDATVDEGQDSTQDENGDGGAEDEGKEDGEQEEANENEPEAEADDLSCIIENATFLFADKNSYINDWLQSLLAEGQASTSRAPHVPDFAEQMAEITRSLGINDEVLPSIDPYASDLENFNQLAAGSSAAGPSSAPQPCAPFNPELAPLVIIDELSEIIEVTHAPPLISPILDDSQPPIDGPSAPIAIPNDRPVDDSVQPMPHQCYSRDADVDPAYESYPQMMNFKCFDCGQQQANGNETEARLNVDSGVLGGIVGSQTAVIVDARVVLKENAFSADGARQNPGPVNECSAGNAVPNVESVNAFDADDAVQNPEFVNEFSADYAVQNVESAGTVAGTIPANEDAMDVAHFQVTNATDASLPDRPGPSGLASSINFSETSTERIYREMSFENGQYSANQPRASGFNGSGGAFGFDAGKSASNSPLLPAEANEPTESAAHHYRETVITITTPYLSPSFQKERNRSSGLAYSESEHVDAYTAKVLSGDDFVTDQSSDEDSESVAMGAETDVVIKNDDDVDVDSDDDVDVGDDDDVEVGDDDDVEVGDDVEVDDDDDVEVGDDDDVEVGDDDDVEVGDDDDVEVGDDDDVEVGDDDNVNADDNTHDSNTTDSTPSDTSDTSYPESPHTLPETRPKRTRPVENGQTSVKQPRLSGSDGSSDSRQSTSNSPLLPTEPNAPAESASRHYRETAIVARNTPYLSAAYIRRRDHPDSPEEPGDNASAGGAPRSSQSVHDSDEDSDVSSDPELPPKKFRKKRAKYPKRRRRIPILPAHMRAKLYCNKWLKNPELPKRYQNLEIVSNSDSD